MIALVTDSNAQLPEDLRSRLGAHVVPVTVVVDGTPYLEGPELDATDVYEHLRRGAEITTAAPSPGQFDELYRSLAAAGAGAILSVHTGANVSGTFNAARVAAASSPVPVELVDTGTASFAVGCCAWAAGDALAAGASLEEAAAAARATARTVGNVFVVGALDLLRRSGRAGAGVGAGAGGDGVPVLVLEDGEVRRSGTALDGREAVELMARYVAERGAGHAIRVGVGDADVVELAADLEAAIRASAPDVDLVRYVVGPSVACHTGVGTVGAVFAPLSL